MYWTIGAEGEHKGFKYRGWKGVYKTSNIDTPTKDAYLPEGTKVVPWWDDGLERVTVKEGPWSGQSFYTGGSHKKGFVTKQNPRRIGRVHVDVRIDMRKLSGEADVSYGSAAFTGVPIVVHNATDHLFGSHRLDMPDRPHWKKGWRHLRFTPYALTWFRYWPDQASSDKGYYLHCGADTAGCVTIKDRTLWARIYHEIINRRPAPGQVGTLAISKY